MVSLDITKAFDTCSSLILMNGQALNAKDSFRCVRVDIFSDLMWHSQLPIEHHYTKLNYDPSWSTALMCCSPNYTRITWFRVEKGYSFDDPSITRNWILLSLPIAVADFSTLLYIFSFSIDIFIYSVPPTYLLILPLYQECLDCETADTWYFPRNALSTDLQL